MRRLYRFIPLIVVLLIAATCAEKKAELFIQKVKERDIAALDKMIEEGFDINQRARDGYFALYAAVQAE
ncbi:MAG: hypothetical protein FVQ80_12615, partial [Planctomycetes bacterium]|nr:hypothetical protein [Planctomycetota bacterium]